MPPPLLKRGLHPSVLDRLIDPESAGTAIMTGYSVEQTRQVVLRDLEELFNSINTFRSNGAAFPETQDSIVAYGLPDLASIEAVSAEQRTTIGKAIKKAIERFEPRLRAIRVTLLDPEEDLARGAIRFRVDARLCVDPSPDVAFDTILEMGSGTYVVTPAEERAA